MTRTFLAFIFLTFATAAMAEDAKSPTVAELQAQVSSLQSKVAEQQEIIAVLQHQRNAAADETAAYAGSVAAQQFLRQTTAGAQKK